MSINQTIYRDDDTHEITVEVEYYYSAGQKCGLFEYGQPMTPDDPEVCEAQATAFVVEGSGPYKAGESIELTPDEIDKAED